MAINRVDYGNTTLIDLNDTTAEAADVAAGKYFYTNAGVRTAGTSTAPVTDVWQNGTSVLDGTIAKVNAAPVVELTQTEYDALSSAEKNNGTIYCVTDSTGTYLTASEVSYGSSSVQNALDNLSYVKVIDIAAFSSLPQTVTNASITANQVCIKAELGTPSAQNGDWTVTTSAGSLTLSGSIIGSTTVKLYLAVAE